MAGSPPPQAATEGGRTARKRQAILAAATDVFLQHGYLGASMDEVAARAAVSKQTVYKHFADKQRLFAEILDGTVDLLDELEDTAALALRDSGDLAKDLGAVAHWLLGYLLRPEVRRLRRLVIGEAGRFPELGRRWYERGFKPGIATVADGLRGLAERGRLRLDDPVLAANHFAGLVLWGPVNQVMFSGDDEQLTDEEINRYAEAGVRAFLAAYGT